MSTSSTNDLLAVLQLAEKSVSRERNQRLSAIGLTSAQAQILSTLHVTGPIGLNELNQRLPTDTPPSRVVSTLVDRRLVTRRDKASDRRHVSLALSALGKRKIAEIRRVDRTVQHWADRRLKRMPVKSAEKALIALVDGVVTGYL